VVDVPGGVQPTTFHAPHGQGVVHVQPTARGEADRAQADVLGTRPATGGHQQLVPLDLARVELGPDHAGAVALDAPDRLSRAHLCP
jgi:hypothetical protein